MTFEKADYADYLSVRDSTHKDLLIYAAKKSGRSPLRIQREFARMAKSPGKLNMVEYVRTGLYDIERFTPEERDQFISNDLHWPITHQCNNTSWLGAAEDKVLAANLLKAGGVPTPETVAVLDKSARIYPGMSKIDTSQSLTALLNEYDGQPLFCKVLDGMVSFA